MPEETDPTDLPPPDPGDDAAAEGNLGQLDDDTWRECHEQLEVLGVPAEQLQYVWAPGVTPEELGLT